jgi:hypothetical protein
MGFVEFLRTNGGILRQRQLQVRLALQLMRILMSGDESKVMLKARFLS